MRLFRVGIGIVVVGVIMCASPLAAQTLRIYQIDVEQADAALFVMPNGKTLLIDAGKNGHGQRIRNVMATAGVTRIDAFVATHYHEDHFGGIDDLVDAGVPVLESFDRGDKGECCVPASKKNETTFKDYQRTPGEDAQTRRHLRPRSARDNHLALRQLDSWSAKRKTPRWRTKRTSVALLITSGGSRRSTVGHRGEHRNQPRGA